MGNDFDGLTDCAEATCDSTRSDSSGCELVPGPMVVGIGADRTAMTFDVPMYSELSAASTPANDLVLFDVDGTGSKRDDIAIARTQGFSLFLNVATVGYASLPRNPIVRTALSAARIAGGDWTGDGKADLVAVNSVGMQKYAGNGLGVFTPSGPLVNPPGPGPENGKPILVGRTIAVANGNLRIYDSRCDTAPPGFPTDEVFGVANGGLCDSTSLHATDEPRTAIALLTSNGKRYVAVVIAGGDVRLYEVVVSVATVFGVTHTTISAQERSAFPAAAAVNDLAFSSTGDLLVFALADGRLQAVQVAGSGAMQASAVFPTINLDAHAFGGVGGRDALSHLTIGPMINGRPTIAVAEQSRTTIYLLPFSTTAGWDRRDLIVETIDDGTKAGARVRGLVMGQFNDDNLLDLAALDATSGQLILLRQQPPPCATYIAAASHGMLTLASFERVPLLDAIATKTYTPLSRFNHLLAAAVDEANAVRRPNNGFRDVTGVPAAICPVRFIDMRGHWEKLSAEGGLIAMAARASWLLSSDTFAPSCWLPLPAVPATTPVEYWASALFLVLGNVNPNDTPDCVADIGIPSDPNTRIRFLLGGVAVGLESVGRSLTSQASLTAARLLNARANDAIADADSLMNPCTGQIFLDLVGHSRGAPMVQQALRRGFNQYNNRGNYNFEVSTTILDGVDPSPSDNLRPWTRGGYVVSDPPIRRVGSEWNSSFHTKNSSGTPVDAAVLLVPNPNPLAWLPWFPAYPSAAGMDEFKRAEAIGLPVGRDRQVELEAASRTFAAYDGPLNGLRHMDLAGDPVGTADGTGMLWVDPTNAGDNFLFAPSAAAAADSSTFAFAQTSKLGELLLDPRGDINSVGFHTSVNFSALEESPCLPSQCNPGPGTCTGIISSQSGAATERVDADGLTTRELVPDFDFRFHGGLVRNAIDIVVDGPRLKRWVLDAGYAGLYTFLNTTAGAFWADTGRWTRVGDIRLITPAGNVGSDAQRFIARADVNLSGVDTQAEAEAGRTAWQTELFGSGTSQASQSDATATLAAAVARTTATGTTSVYAQYPASTSSLSTALRAASLTSATFFIRVEYAMRSSSTGSLRFTLAGPGLSKVASYSGATSGTGRKVAELSASRVGTFAEGIDQITVEGKDVNLYSVSVRTAAPAFSHLSGADYEFVLLEDGITQETARRLAERSMYQGRPGRLARVTSTSLQSELASLCAPDAKGWADGFSATGASASFQYTTTGGGTVASGLFLAGTTFTAPRPRGASVYMWPAPQGARFGHAPPTVSVGGQRVGYWIEYPPAGSALVAGGSSMLSGGSVAAEQPPFGSDGMSLAEGGSTEDEAEDDEEGTSAAPVVEPAPPPDCEDSGCD